MLTQQQIADHLDLSQQAVADLMERLGIRWREGTLDAIRVAYIRHLRGQASGHKSDDGMDLIKERVMTERVDRELKTLTVAEKKGTLINVAQLEPELMHMVGAFRAEMLARDDKLKTELDTLYGIDIDVNLLNDHTFAALEQLARYDAGHREYVATVDANAAPTGADVDNGMGAALSEDERKGDGAAGTVQP